MACILLWGSAVRVHDSQAYKEDGCDKGEHQSYLAAERNTLVNPNWFHLGWEPALINPGQKLDSRQEGRGTEGGGRGGGGYTKMGSGVRHFNILLIAREGGVTRQCP